MTAPLSLPPAYLVKWGWSNGAHAYTASFDAALDLARQLLAERDFPPGRELPTIVNPSRVDENTDGLTEAEREMAEAAGLEVTRP